MNGLFLGIGRLMEIKLINMNKTISIIVILIGYFSYLLSAVFRYRSWYYRLDKKRDSIKYLLDKDLKFSLIFFITGLFFPLIIFILLGLDSDILGNMWFPGLLGFLVLIIILRIIFSIKHKEKQDYDGK